MRIIDQNISLYAHNQSYSREQQSEQKEEFVGGRLVNQQSKTVDSLNSSSTVYRQDSLNLQEADLRSSTSPSSGRVIHNNDRDRDQDSQRLGSLLNNERANDPFKDRVTLSKQNNQAGSLNRSEQIDKDRINLPPKLREMIEAIEAMMEKLTGKKTTLQVYGYNTNGNPAENNPASALKAETPLFSPESITQKFNEAFRQTFQQNFQVERDPRVSPEQMNLKGTRLTFSQSYQESETTSFRAAGNVTTADGKTIDFAMSTQMSRQYYSATQMQVEEGFILKDPLVVNFDGQPASLSVDRVKFDLDSDGELENMLFLNAGSGFLFLDRNKDGQVNNGNELFGTQSGNGFADLQQYDEDQNGWIDENDSVFSQLQIWHKNAQGMEEMTGLMELNIGAIYLQSVESPFTFKDDKNQTQGQVVSSGVFLTEEGEAGTVQQIDLAV